MFRQVEIDKGNFMTSALIGYTGFVGSTLLKQRSFDELYRSTNISEIDNKSFDFVVCAAAPAKKWYANQNPVEDKKNIDSLIKHLKQITIKKFVLISTVDVFKNPVEVNEKSIINMNDLQPYGFNRRRLELFVEQNFDDYLIVRLPGLVGNGLKKNIIFDFKNDNNIEKIESRNVFQFYPMKYLNRDINIAIENNLKLIHLTSSPLSVKEIAKYAFNKNFDNEISNQIVHYDFKTIYSYLWNGITNTTDNSDYQYSKDDSLSIIKEYAYSEPRSLL